MLENEIFEKACRSNISEHQKGKLKCKICSKHYAVKDSLKVHMLTIHEKKMSFGCTYQNCAKKYFNKYKLECHLRAHTGERPYKCSLCRKTFTTKGNLSTHFKFHGNPQKFNCVYCSKQYTSKGNLVNHINIVHFKEKKYACTICHQFFGRSSSLKTHLEHHSGKKPFACQVVDCDKRYTEKGNLSVHQQNKHPAFCSDVHKKNFNQKDTLIESEANKIRCTLVTDATEPNKDKEINELISHLDILCPSLSEDKIQEEILANILGFESENDLIDFYLLLQQEEDNNTESGTCESSTKILFPIKEGNQLTNEL